MTDDLGELLRLHAADPGDAEINYRCAAAHDRLGQEHEAIPFYLRAIEAGLDDDLLRSALLGLGSSYRAIGAYPEAVEALDRGISRFPEADEFKVFKAMALHNLGESAEAVSMLLKTLVATTDHDGIARYQKALLFYADRLDETW